MPSEKPLFRDYLRNCLINDEFPRLLFWTNEEEQEFAVNLMRKNQKGWSEEFAAHYIGWDLVNFHAGFKSRAANLNAQSYITSSKHRFKTALKRLVDQRELLPKKGSENEDVSIYQFISLDSEVDQLESSDSLGTANFDKKEGTANFDKKEGTANVDKKELVLSFMNKLTIPVKGRPKTFYMFCDSKARIQWSDESLQTVYYIPMLPHGVVKMLENGSELSKMGKESFSITDSNILYMKDQCTPQSDAIEVINSIAEGLKMLEKGSELSKMEKESFSITDSNILCIKDQCDPQSDAIEVINSLAEGQIYDLNEIVSAEGQSDLI